MSNSSHTCRQPLASVQARQIPAQSLAAFTLLDEAAGDCAQPVLNGSAIAARAATFGEPVDPGLARLLAQEHRAKAGSTVAVPQKRNTIAARAFISAAMHGGDDDDIYEDQMSSIGDGPESEDSLTLGRERGIASERKARLLRVAEGCSLTSPPSDEDLMLM